jgi:general secretion pathway protein G
MEEKKHLETLKLSFHSTRGFSLIEILIALSLLALVGTFVGGKMFEQLHEGKVGVAKTQMGNIANILKDFKRKCYFYPTSEQGLKALENKPTTGRECKRYPATAFLEEVPLDPWDGEYDYKSDGKTFNMVSFGADNVEGGEDQDADIPFRTKKKRNK